MTAIPYSRGRDKFDAHPANREASDFDTFEARVLADRALAKGLTYIAAPFRINGDGQAHRCKEGTLPRAWLPFDLDGVRDAEAWSDICLWLQRYRGFAYTTSRHTPEVPRARFILAASRAVDRAEGQSVCLWIEADLRREFGDGIAKFDRSVYSGWQPCYTPLHNAQTVRFEGAPVDVDAVLLVAPSVDAERPGTTERARIEAARDPVLRQLVDRGMIKREMKDGRYAIECPCSDQHSSGSNETSTIYMLPNFGGVKYGKFVCLHDHCRDRDQREFLAALDLNPRGVWREQSGKADTATADEFEDEQKSQAVALSDFYAYMPLHNYIFTPTRELWPASGVNGRIRDWPQTADGKPIRPSDYLDAHRPIDQMIWSPGEPEIVKGRVLQMAGWIAHSGAVVFNQYRAPAPIEGDHTQATPWINHVCKVYPDDADHIIGWLAQRIQRPGEKINHALVLGGAQGIGKDTILEPVKAGVGPWNWQEINPVQMLGRFNAWAKAVVVRVSEARDLGEVDRFTFYDHSKVYIAAPPDVLRVDEKHLREHYITNVAGVIITTNHAGDGLYLPADDRRHFVAWSTLTRADFPEGYWSRLYDWYANGGTGHVVAFLRQLNIGGTDWKAPPRQTAAFWNIVASGDAPESGELNDVIDDMGNPPAFVVTKLIDRAQAVGHLDLASELADRKSRRALPHKLERVGYVPVRNPDADDGLFKLQGKRQVIYAKRALPLPQQIREARRLCGLGRDDRCSQ